MKHMKSLLGLLVCVQVISACEKSEEEGSIEHYEQQFAESKKAIYSDTIAGLQGLSEQIHLSILSKGQMRIEHPLLDVKEDELQASSAQLARSRVENVVSLVVKEYLDILERNNSSGESIYEGTAEDDYEPTLTVDIDGKRYEYKDIIAEYDLYYFKDDRTGSVTLAMYYPVTSNYIRLELTWIGGVLIEARVDS